MQLSRLNVRYCRLSFNPLLADPSYDNANVVKFVVMRYSKYLMGKIYFLIFFVTVCTYASMFPKWERWQLPACIICQNKNPNKAI